MTNGEKKNFKKLPLYFSVLLLMAPTIASAQGGISGAIGATLSNAIEGLIVIIANFIYSLVSWITAKMGQIMDWTIEFFIIDMSSNVESISAINELWRIIRDLGNIVFIFLILFAAISLILDNGDYRIKRLLPKIVVVALFVNFSLFVTKVVIDVSNVFALQIYENISVSGMSNSSGVNISNAIVDQLNLSSLLSTSGMEAIGGAGTSFRVAFLHLISAGVVGLAGFVFISFAALISIRFFVLILLMIGSPIAFIAYAIPDNNFAESWWTSLINQAFFAPAMMLMLYITLYVGKSMKESGIFTGSDLAQAIISPSGNIDILIFYAVLIGLLIASLIIAKRMGAIGANKAVSTGKSIADWGRAKVTGGVKHGAGMAARGAVGYTGRKIDEKVFKGSKLAKRYYGKEIREKTTGKMKGASFGTGTSYEDVRKAKKKADRDVESYERKEEAKSKFEDTDSAGEKRRTLKELSTKERLEFIKQNPEERAQFASQSDIDKLESDDDFSAEDVRKIKQHRFDLTDEADEDEGYKASEILEAIDNNDTNTLDDIEDTIKNNLQFVSNNEIKEDINLDLEAGEDTEAGAERRMTIQAMNASQIESLMENKTSDERERIKKDVSQILEDKIDSGDIDDFLGDMDTKNLARYLKNAESDVREKDEIIEQIDEKVVSELQGELSTGEQESLREAVLDRATRPGTTTTDKNRRAAEHLEYGPGAAT